MLSEDDISLLAAAQALELAARDIYASAVSRKSKSEEEQGLLELMHSHHTAYEQTLNGVLSKRAATERNAEAYTKFFAHKRSELKERYEKEFTLSEEQKRMWLEAVAEVNRRDPSLADVDVPTPSKIKLSGI